MPRKAENVGKSDGEVPDVKKAVRWNSPWLDICEGELDEEQMGEWVGQSAGLPGWDGF